MFNSFFYTRLQVWYNCLFIWNIFFTITFSKVSLIFCLSWKTFILPSFLKGIFTEYATLDFSYFILAFWRCSSTVFWIPSLLLRSQVSNCHSFKDNLLFSPATFKISFWYFMSCVWVWISFSIFRLVVCWALCTCKLVYLVSSTNFSSTIHSIVATFQLFSPSVTVS